MGAVFLALIGEEALYADIGHFGLRPIRLAWFWLVMPCLLLNYFGQGALVLADEKTASNPFFLLAPSWLQLPVVFLATAATVIASQAVILRRVFDYEPSGEARLSATHAGRIHVGDRGGRLCRSLIRRCW